MGFVHGEMSGNVGRGLISLQSSVTSLQPNTIADIRLYNSEFSIMNWAKANRNLKADD